MTIQNARLKTQAETQLAAQFAALGDVAPARKAAFARFAAQGLPNRRNEAYHFTDVRAAMGEAMPLAGLTAQRGVEKHVADQTLIVIRDGRYDAAMSAAMPAGVTLEEVANNAADDQTGDPVLALNAAFSARQLLIAVAAGLSVAAPIHLEMLSGEHSGRSVHARVRITLGPGASLTLIESHHGQATANQGNFVLGLELADHASFAHITQIDGGGGLVLASLEAQVGANCELSSFALLSGGTLVRRQLFVTLNGEHSNLSLDGVSLLRGAQHIDTTLVVTHKAAHCTSRETFRHIVQDEATGVFQGKINVCPGAQKTDGKMMSKTILLGDNAVMNNKPELEIFADDVVCGHGATVGGLDEDQIFYARSRGIPKAEAEALLLEAFAGEVVDTISHKASREAMREHLRSWLAGRKA